MQGSHAFAVLERGPPRVSLPATTIAQRSEIGTLPGDAASLNTAHTNVQPSERSCMPHPGAGDAERDEGSFTDTSSDFSYGSSDGSAASEDAEERLVMRQARKALQVARKAARKVCSLCHDKDSASGWASWCACCAGQLCVITMCQHQGPQFDNAMAYCYSVSRSTRPHHFV